MEHKLWSLLDGVARRWRVLSVTTALATNWLVWAILGGAALAAMRWLEVHSPWPALVVISLSLAGGLACLVVCAAARINYLAVARRIEAEHPELDARLLAAIEPDPAPQGEQPGYLRAQVLLEAVVHGRRHGWRQVVPLSRLCLAQAAQLGGLALLAGVVVCLWAEAGEHGMAAALRGPAPVPAAAAPLEIVVEPGDTEVERGTNLLVLARFEKRLPADVRLLYETVSDQSGEKPMPKSLDDPLFAARIVDVQTDLAYRVEFDGQASQTFHATVFEYPDLERADARLVFPGYTGLEPSVVEDVRRVTAVEGTKLTLICRLNKPVVEARLEPRADRSADGAPLEPLLLAPGDEQHTYSVTWTLANTARYHLHLTDAEGRSNKEPPELLVQVTRNQPPDLKLVQPRRDVEVSPLEELTLRASAYDDFGLVRVGLSYVLADGEPIEVLLDESVPARSRREFSHPVDFEALRAQPDQLLSYYFWAEDSGPDGTVRRTSGDMFFAEVRPFEEIYRQGQQPPGGSSESGQGENAEQSQQLAELQKQIITATWNLLRRESGAADGSRFVADVVLIGDAQQDAIEQAAALAQRLSDPQSQALLELATGHMQSAATRLDEAAADGAAAPLESALSSERSAYQALLKLRAREHQVIRGQRGQRGGGGGASRSQAQLDQLELDAEENRYETQTAAGAQSPENERENRQVLNRLRELAQRQEDLNRRVEELQSALQAAQDEARREEIRRQLQRLREQQEQVLRDTDELRERMDRPENQERMADARQQLDATRSNVRRASDALEQGMVSQALAEGTRASDDFRRLRDDFRQQTARQFDQQMRDLRQQAQDLDRRQQELAEQMTRSETVGRRSLRDTSQRGELTSGLSQQKQQLEQLLDQMRELVEQAESAEPLLSRQLYDAARRAQHDKPAESLDAASQWWERGFPGEARQAEAVARQSIGNLRQDVERAAESVLGGDEEALRRARDELAALAEQLQQEMLRAAGQQPGDEGNTGRGARPDAADSAAAQQGSASDSSRQSSGDAGQEPGPRQPPDGAEQAGQAPRSEQRDPARQGAGSREPRDRDDQDAPPQGEAGQRGSSQGQPQQRDPQQGQREQGQSQPDDSQQGQSQQGQSQQGQSQQGQSQQGQSQQGQPGEGQGSQPGTSQRGQGSEPSEAEGTPSESQRGGQPAAQAGGQPQRSGPQSLRGGGTTGPSGLEQMLGGRSGPHGPITGEDFREWSDRLRDVEEMLTDPQLRAEAARIRDRARGIRVEFKRHSKEPNWDLVREFITRPLVELRDAVGEELARRQSPDALVPIDRDPVPPSYRDQVRRYYERLGSGQ